MLEALLENPILIVIIIGIISSLFGKSKSAEEAKKQKRKKPQPKTQTPAELNRETKRPQPSTFKEMKKTVEKCSVHPPTIHEATVELENEFEKRKNEHAEKLKELQEKQRLIEKAADELHTGMNRKRHFREMQQKRATDDSLPTYGSRLVDGIVLSEILGKPRAKNPHNSRRF